MTYPAFVDESARRDRLWRELQANGGPDQVAPGLLQRLAIYRGASGIWYDRAATGSTDPRGITVGVLHTGRHYADDLTDERILYHYPRTTRGGRDSVEINATKAAADLHLPVFVIKTSIPARLRDVRRGHIVGQDDSLEIFNIELEAPFQSLTVPTGRVTRRRTAQLRAWGPYRRADEATAAAARDPFTIDPDKIDRGLHGHASTQNAIADWLIEQAIEPNSATRPPVFDVRWQVERQLFVGEVKSLTAANQPQQMRLGLGQVLDYRDLLSSDGSNVTAVLILEHEPEQAARWTRLCAQVGVVLVWPATFNRLLPHFATARS